MTDEEKLELAKQVIAHLAVGAENIGAASGSGGCELAGMMISYLSAHPEKIETFFREGWIEAIGDDDPWADGCLTWHRKGDGRVTTPDELRASKEAKKASAS